VIAFATGAPSWPAIEASLGLAAAVGASLEGLFVEDSALLRLSSLPLARETSVLTGVQRALAAGEVERALRVHATRHAQLLAESAARRRVPWSFAVARGQLVPQAVAHDADLIVLSPRERHARTARQPSRPGPIATLFDASAGAQRALAATSRLADALGCELLVLVPDGEAQAAQALRREAREWLNAQPVAGRTLLLAADQAALLDTVRTSESVLLALPATALEAWPIDLESLLARVLCPLVIAR